LLDIIEVIKPNKDNYFHGGNWQSELLKRKLIYDFKGEKGSQEFENLFDKVLDKNSTAVVLQLTDDWKMPDETYDGTIAAWAKDNAKTFMSIVYGGADSRANKEMIKAGHPNIYLAEPDGNLIPNDVRSQKIKEQIAATTVEKVTKGENQLVKVTIGGNGVSVTKATLKGAVNKDLAIKDGKVDFSEKLADGNYSVEFVVEGNGTVTTVVTIDGKEVTKKSADIKSTAGSKGSSATVTDKLNALVLPTAPKSQPITVNDITVVAKKPVLGTVESEVATVTTEKELNKVTFKETVTPISFERTVTPAQAEVTTHDVYVKTAKAVKTLPNTGTTDSSMVEVAGAGLGLVGLLSLYGLKRKED
jgi:LPXTG-motif cell wall anchor domain protein